MRVVLWGTCDLSKPRVRILLDGLQRNGVEVIECRADTWSDVRDKSQIGLAAWALRLARMVGAYPVLAWRYLRLPRHDWVLLGYPSIPDIYVIRLFAWLRGTRIAMDWFLSAYDTVVCDRRLVGRHHPLAWLLWLAEWLAVRLADRAFMDTRTHATRMERLFGLPSGHCGVVWVGAEEDHFPPSPAGRQPPREGRPFRVLFYGQFIPLHGVPTIVEAARLLCEAPVEWQLVGTGQDAARVRAMLDGQPLPRVSWDEWVPYEALAQRLCAADLCLGIFGTSDKAASVIPNKVFQAVAIGCPVLTRDSPAIRELLDPADPCCLLVPAGDPAALADAIQQAAGRHDTMTGVPCHAGLHASISPRMIGAQLMALLSPHAPGATGQ